MIDSHKNETNIVKQNEIVLLNTVVAKSPEHTHFFA